MATFTFEITFSTLGGNTQTVFIDARSESAAEMEFSRCYKYDEILSTEDVTEYSEEEGETAEAPAEEIFTFGMTMADKDWKTFAAFVATFKVFPIFEMESDSEGNIEIISKDENFIDKLFNHLS